MEKRIKKNASFLLAGAVVAAVMVNVWYELERTKGGRDPCLYISTQ